VWYGESLFYRAGGDLRYLPVPTASSVATGGFSLDPIPGTRYSVPRGPDGLPNYDCAQGGLLVLVGVERGSDRLGVLPLDLSMSRVRWAGARAKGFMQRIRLLVEMAL
jgi:hypothetical protein